MKLSATLLLALVFVFSLEQETKLEGDLAKLQGSWKAENLGPERDLTVILTFKGQNVLYVARKGDGEEQRKVEAVVKLDESTDPKQITLTAENQDLPDNLGIYKFDSDGQLIIRAGTQERPSEFVEGAEDQTTFKRQKDE
jgi:uncharacterized protein (TIGR03067 family)